MPVLILSPRISFCRYGVSLRGPRDFFFRVESREECDAWLRLLAQHTAKMLLQVRLRLVLPLLLPLVLPLLLLTLLLVLQGDLVKMGGRGFQKLKPQVHKDLCCEFQK